MQPETNSAGKLGKLPSGAVFVVPPTTDFVHSLLTPRKMPSISDFATLLLVAANFAVFLVVRPPRWFFLLAFLFWRCAYNVGLGEILYHQSKSRLLVKLAYNVGLRSKFDSGHTSSSPVLGKEGELIQAASPSQDINANVSSVRGRSANGATTTTTTTTEDTEYKSNGKEISKSTTTKSTTTTSTSAATAANAASNVSGKFTKRSTSRSPIVRYIQEHVKFWVPILKQEVETKMSTTSPGFQYDDYPTEFNVWVLYRGLVDIILINDFTCYFLFVLSYSNNPSWREQTLNDVFRYMIGFLMLLFNLWIKTDAHRVVKDFAWYWGDFFFLVDDNLQFDGVFEMAPHPMYSVGYIGFYAAALIASSYWVLFVSLLGHTGQMLFLNLVETPHIEKIYNPPKMDKEAETFSTKYSKKFSSRDMIWIQNMDLHRATDMITVVFCIQLLLTSFLVVGPIPRNADGSFMSGFIFLPWQAYYYISQAIFWSTMHIVGSGYILNTESKNKNWTRHFIKQGDTPLDAFHHWKGIYNFTQMASHISFFLAFARFLIIPQSITDGGFLLKLTVGLLFIVFHIYVIVSTIEVIGTTGWFYGDFFLEELRLSSGPSNNGLYRYINNPLLFTFTSWGLALISGSPYISFIAVYQQALNWLFIQFVENPAMNILYKDQIQEEAGIHRFIRSNLTYLANQTRNQLNNFSQRVFNTTLLSNSLMNTATTTTKTTTVTKKSNKHDHEDHRHHHSSPSTEKEIVTTNHHKHIEEAPLNGVSHIVRTGTPVSHVHHHSDDKDSHHTNTVTKETIIDRHHHSQPVKNGSRTRTISTEEFINGDGTITKSDLANMLSIADIKAGDLEGNPEETKRIEKVLGDLKLSIANTKQPWMKEVLSETAQHLSNILYGLQKSPSIPEEIKRFYTLDVHATRNTHSVAGVHIQSIRPSSDPSERQFYLGQEICIEFTSVFEHMTGKDWIGIYPVGANKMSNVTSISSQGKWLWVSAVTQQFRAHRLGTGSGSNVNILSPSDSFNGYSFDQDGDEDSELLALSSFSVVGGLERRTKGEQIVLTPSEKLEEKKSVSANIAGYSALGTVVRGKLVFSGDELPWMLGKYELRYHLHGTHSCVATSALPFEVVCPLFDWDAVERESDYSSEVIKEKVLEDVLVLVGKCIDAPHIQGDVTADEDVGADSRTGHEHEKPLTLDADILSKVKIRPGVDDSAPQFDKYKTLVAQRVVDTITIRYGVEFNTRVLFLAGNCRNLADRIVGARIALRPHGNPILRPPVTSGAGLLGTSF